MNIEELCDKLERIDKGGTEQLTKEEANLVAKSAIMAITRLVQGYPLSPLSQKQFFMFAASQLELFVQVPV